MQASGIKPTTLVNLPVPHLAWAIHRLPSRMFQLFAGRRVSRARGGKLPSLLLDVRAGRQRLEVDWLNGAIAARAAAVRLKTPANSVVTRILDGIAAGSIERRRG